MDFGLAQLLRQTLNRSRQQVITSAVAEVSQ